MADEQHWNIKTVKKPAADDKTVDYPSVFWTFWLSGCSSLKKWSRQQPSLRHPTMCWKDRKTLYEDPDGRCVTVLNSVVNVVWRDNGVVNVNNVPTMRPERTLATFCTLLIFHTRTSNETSKCQKGSHPRPRAGIIDILHIYRHSTPGTTAGHSCQHSSTA